MWTQLCERNEALFSNCPSDGVNSWAGNKMHFLCWQAAPLVNNQLAGGELELGGWEGAPARSSQDAPAREVQLCSGNPRPSCVLEIPGPASPLPLATPLSRCSWRVGRWGTSGSWGPLQIALFLVSPPLDTSRNACSLCHMVMDGGGASGQTVPCLNIAFPFSVAGGCGVHRTIPDPTPREAPGVFITMPIKPVRFMALLFNSFNALFIGRLMLLIYFLLKQIKTICADTGLDFWHGPERSAFNFIFIDYTDNIICIKNRSLNPCHFTTRVRGSHHGAGFSLPVSSFPFCFPLHPSPLFSLFLLHCWMPFRFFLCCFYAFCDICSSTISLPLSPSRFSLLLFHFFPPLRLHCICLPGSTAICAQSETLRFGVFGHPSSFLCEGGALDQGGGRNRVINVEQFWVLIVRSTAFLRDSFWVISAFKLLLPQTPGFSSPTSSGNSDGYSKALIISGNISFPSF